MSADAALRLDLVTQARALDACGMNRGSAGNLSLRSGGAMLITPSAIPAAALTPDLIVRMPLDGSGSHDGSIRPSTEWRFHHDLLRARPELNAVVHTHAPFSTILAIARRPIPAIHYMMAAFGGPDIRVAGYARYGTAALSEKVVAAMQGRQGCLMANHGMLTAAATLPQAVWLAQEMEALAHHYVHLLQIGGGHVLSDAEIAEAAQGFATYGAAASADRP